MRCIDYFSTLAEYFFVNQSDLLRFGRGQRLLIFIDSRDLGTKVETPHTTRQCRRLEEIVGSVRWVSDSALDEGNSYLGVVVPAGLSPGSSAHSRSHLR